MSAVEKTMMELAELLRLFKSKLKNIKIGHDSSYINGLMWSNFILTFQFVGCWTSIRKQDNNEQSRATAVSVGNDW